MSKFDEVLKVFAENKKNHMTNKEQFLIQLEQIFDNSNWDDVMVVVNEAIATNVQDPVVDSIIEYVQQKNRISFKQWKVLRYHINLCNKKPKKYKYGN